jgi:mannitol/fructose-specific phosphotransferase system IIA component
MAVLDTEKILNMKTEIVEEKEEVNKNDDEELESFDIRRLDLTNAFDNRINQVYDYEDSLYLYFGNNIAIPKHGKGKRKKKKKNKK